MSTPWYKEPWAYLVFILPLSAVVAGITTVIIANTNPDTIVVDDYYKKGKSINQDIRKYKLAKKLGIRFDYQITDNEIILKPTGIEKEFPVLNVHFYHSTLSKRDFDLKLTADGNGLYRQSFDKNVHGKWRISISPYDDKWRMQMLTALPQQNFRNFEIQY